LGAKARKDFSDHQEKEILAKSIKLHRSKDQKGSDMVRFHVDCDRGDYLSEMENNVYSRNCSVRCLQNDSQEIVVGHDKANTKSVYTMPLDYGQWNCCSCYAGLSTSTNFFLQSCFWSRLWGLLEP